MNTVKPKKRGNPAVVKNVEEDTKRDQMKQPLKTTKKFKKGGPVKMGSGGGVCRGMGAARAGGKFKLR